MRTNPLPDRLRIPLAWAGALWLTVTPRSAVAEETGYLHVISDPRGGYVIVDGTLVGRTPLEPFVVAAGGHDVWVRSNPPDAFEPKPRGVRRVTVAAGDTAVVAEELGYLHRITSLPDGASVRLGSKTIGRTPLEFRWHRGDPTNALLTREDYRNQRVSFDPVRLEGDTHVVLVADGSGEPPAPVVTRDDGLGLNWKALGFLAVGAASAGVALALKDRADEAYDDYLASAQPGVMQDRLDEANRYDRYSSAAWLAAEAGIAVGVWFLIRPIFGLDVTPLESTTDGRHAGVGLAWDF